MSAGAMRTQTTAQGAQPQPQQQQQQQPGGPAVFDASVLEAQLLAQTRQGGGRY